MDFRACAIDGPGGSGKSTLARQLADFVGATIIPMDHFLLPAENHRISAIAKNYDLDRFDHEVVGAIIAGGPISYKLPESSDSEPKWVRVPMDKPVIIDGIYSLELRFRETYDFSIFVDTDKETRLRRSTQITTGSGSWVDKWLIGEDTYLAAQSPLSAATLILDGAKPFPTPAQVIELVLLRLRQTAN